VSVLTRITSALGFNRRAVLSDLGPFDPKTDGAWSVVRSQEPANYRRAGETIRRQGFETNAIVYACARVTADQIGTAHLEAYRLGPQQTVVLEPDGAYQKFLDQPAPQLPGFTMRRTIALYVLLYGNAYILIGNVNGQKRLRIIHPERVQQVMVDGVSDEIVAYVWTDNAGLQHVTPWTEMVHVKDHLVDPDMYFGFPRGLAALFQMVTDTEASKYVRQILNNSGIPALVFFARQGTSADELKRAEAMWRERMVERGERGSTRFLGGVEQMQVVGHTLKDLEFPSLRQISREDICAAFGVDPRLIGAASAKGNEGGLSGSQYQEARRRLEQQTCHPVRVAMQDAIDTVLSPEFGDLYARFSPDAISAIVETPTELAERVAVLVAANVMTLDEARRAVGLPEAQRPEHLTAAPSLQTIGDALEAADEAEDSSTDEADDDEEDTPPAASERSVRTASLSRVRRGTEVGRWTRADLDAAWQAADDIARAFEVEFAAEVVEVFHEIERYVQDALSAATDEQVRSAPWYERFVLGLSGLFGPDGPIRRLWARRLLPALQRITLSTAERLSTELGRALAPNDAALRAAIQRRMTRMAEQVTGTTMKRLEDAIRAAQRANLSPADLRALLRQTLLEEQELFARALRIARTEVIGAMNDGEYVVAQAALADGEVLEKAWLSQRDERVRPSHVRCDAAGFIPLAATFPNGLRYPHDPNGSADEVVNCRCFLRFSSEQMEDET
jgi:HK97 family phage portal protein